MAKLIRERQPMKMFYDLEDLDGAADDLESNYMDNIEGLQRAWRVRIGAFDYDLQSYISKIWILTFEFISYVVIWVCIT